MEFIDIQGQRRLISNADTPLELCLQDPEEDFQDMIDLPVFSEPSLLYNLKIRFQNDAIYVSLSKKRFL